MTTLLRLTLLFAAGVLAGLRFPFENGAVVGLVAAVCVLLSAAFNGLGSPRIIAFAFVILGWSGGAAAALAAQRDCRAQLADGVVLSGVAVIDGRAEPGAAVLLRLERVRVRGASHTCSGTVRARLPSKMPEVQAGAHVRVSGSWWRFPSRRRWPRPAAQTGLLSVRRVEHADADHSHPLIAARARALARVSRVFARERPLAEALIMAHRESLDTQIRQDFAASGLTHLLAISGSHVGVVAGMILLIARMARLRERRAAILAVVGSAAYVLFLGAPAAAARAALQGVALLASRLTQRPADPLALLALAALLLIANDPLVLLDIGFQLSFAGVFGLVAFQRAALRLLPASWPRPLATALAATLAATFTTGPIVAWHFGLVSWISPAANLVAGPLVALTVPALALALLVDPLSESLAAFLADGAQLLLTLLRHVARIATAVPASHQFVTTEAVTAALLALLAFFLVLQREEKERGVSPEERVRRRMLRLPLRVAVALAVLAVWPRLRPGGNGNVEIHTIDVGQGDAFAIRTPHGRWLLIDAGPVSGRYDAGRSTVVPYLLEHGANRIEAVILTHPHADHIGGVRAVWRMLAVGPVFDPAVAAAQELYTLTLAAAQENRIRWFAARAGREIRIDDLTLRILAPPDSQLDALADPNDYSVVLRLEYGRFAALFLGDAPRAVENRLVAEHGPLLSAALIKVGHHGSRTSTGDSLLHAVRPVLAIVPVGRRNRYGHPSPDVLLRLRQHGVHILRTDEGGSMIVKARPDGTMQLVRER